MDENKLDIWLHSHSFAVSGSCCLPGRVCCVQPQVSHMCSNNNVDHCNVVLGAWMKHLSSNKFSGFLFVVCVIAVIVDINLICAIAAVFVSTVVCKSLGL